MAGLEADAVFSCGCITTLAKCKNCNFTIIKEAKLCDHCELDVKPKEPKKIPEPVRKKPKPVDGGFTARMFHPFNGRHNFEPTSSSLNIMNAKVNISPRLLEEMELWKSQHPHASELEIQQEFGME